MPKFAYQNMEETLNDMRKDIEKIILAEQRAAEERGDNPGLPEVQEKIYEKFAASISPETIERFNEEFNILTSQREVILSRKVEESNRLVKDGFPKKNLLKAHFLKIVAKDRTPIVKNGNILYEEQRRIVPITDYYNESTIDLFINKAPLDYIPEFIRKNGKRADLDEVELLSISNITGLYDPALDIKPKRSLEDSLRFQFHSRIKGSEREKIKAVDWLLGLREENDYPYDGIGIIPIFPDEGYSGKECGKMMYDYLSYVKSISAKNKKIIVKHIQTEEQNNKTGIIKLIGKYDKNNYDQVMRQCVEADRLATQRKYANKDYVVTRDEIERMLQGIQVKSHIDGDRAEIWIMNQTIYNIYNNSEHIGHTAEYLMRRLIEREAYLHNPALSDGKKGKYASIVDPKEPSLAIVGKRLEEGICHQMFKTKSNLLVI